MICVLNVHIIITDVTIINTCSEHMAEWLRCWTRDQEVWGSISEALVIYKSLGQALDPHRLYPPSSNGYQVEQKIGAV